MASRFKTYAQFMRAIGAKIGDNAITNQLADWLNVAFNERKYYARTFAQFPDISLWESRIPDVNSLIAYSQGNGLNDIDVVWGVYGNSPFDGTQRLAPMNPTLTDAGIYVQYPNPATGEGAPDGVTSTVWIKYVPSEPEFTGSNWSAATAYNAGDVTYDPTSGDYYTALQSNTNQAVSNATYWKRLRIPAVIFNYIVHSVYAFYLLTYKQNDKAAVTEEWAEQKFLWPERDKLLKQNQRPVRRMINYVTSQSRRL